MCKLSLIPLRFQWPSAIPSKGRLRPPQRRARPCRRRNLPVRLPRVPERAGGERERLQARFGCIAALLNPPSSQQQQQERENPLHGSRHGRRPGPRCTRALAHAPRLLRALLPTFAPTHGHPITLPTCYLPARPTRRATGWLPQHLLLRERKDKRLVGAVPLYLKARCVAACCCCLPLCSLSRFAAELFPEWRVASGVRCAFNSRGGYASLMSHISIIEPIISQAHSYGEYVFDQSWASAAARNGCAAPPRHRATHAHSYAPLHAD